MEEINKVQRLGESRNSMYWIVYQTINLKNNKIYIGVHKTQYPYTFDGYLGCGVYVNAPRSYMFATTAFEAAVKKYGPKSFRRIVLKICNNAEEAYEEEANLVNEDFLKRHDVYNMIPGGRISYVKKAATPLYMYSLQGQFIKEFSSTQSTKYTQASQAAELGNIVDKKYRFCYVKAESYSKARDIYIKQRTIYQYNSKGEFLKEWKYLEALKQFPKDRINQSIRHKTITKSGYYWGLRKYNIYNEPVVKQQRKIAKYTLNNELVEIYKNSSECYKINGKNTYKVLVGMRKSYKGFIYKYIE
nr:MAG TPA: intron associated endonuclease [Caudoviricetes sp.]